MASVCVTLETGLKISKFAIQTHIVNYSNPKAPGQFWGYKKFHRKRESGKQHATDAKSANGLHKPWPRVRESSHATIRRIVFASKSQPAASI